MTGDEILDRLIADPPRVHGWQGPHVPDGVWATSRECYQFIWRNTLPGQCTLETGCGVSTAVFQARGTEHTCVYLEEAEGDLFAEWADRLGLDVSSIRMCQGGSDVVLPTLPADASFDLVFIDGGHAFPLPIIDWFYASKHLKQGGFLVLDDINLPGVQRLVEFLDHDPRWTAVERSDKWAAYRKLTNDPVSEEWTAQPWLPSVRASDVALVAQARAGVYRMRGRARRLLRLGRR